MIRPVVRTLATIGLPMARTDTNRRGGVARLLMLVALASLAVWLCACGGSGASHSSSAKRPASDSPSAAELRPAPLEAKADADKDNDIGAAEDDTNNSLDFDYGHAASPSLQRTLTALVKRYYAIALAGEGARGCAMLYSPIAEGITEDDSREPGGPAYMRGATDCAQVLDALFKHFHAQLAAEVPILQVTAVRVERGYAWALLRFGTMPERKIPAKREGHVWRMGQIYDLPLV